MRPTLYKYVFCLVNLYLLFISKIHKRNLEIFSETEPCMKYKGYRSQNLEHLYLIFKIKSALFHMVTSIYAHTQEVGSGWILFCQKLHNPPKAADSVIIANMQKMMMLALKVTGREVLSLPPSPCPCQLRSAIIPLIPLLTLGFSPQCSQSPTLMCKDT